MNAKGVALDPSDSPFYANFPLKPSGGKKTFFFFRKGSLI